ncbi:MAG: response regulator [bacterium]|nr:response regulator [bacterium]
MERGRGDKAPDHHLPGRCEWGKANGHFARSVCGGFPLKKRKPEAFGKRKRVLVIDDEVELCSLLEAVLTDEGYAVLSCCDPVEGLRIARKERPHLVLLDLRMPKMDGLQVLQEMKKHDETIRVIIITGFPNISQARDAIRLGAHDYITKPFDLSYIKAVVRDALEPASWA